MLYRQRGLSLLGVTAVSVLVAGLAMVALMSARHERNYFAEGWAKVSGKVAESPVADAVKGAAGAGAGAPAAGVMRKCVIDGKTVISNVDCSDKNPTSRDIKIHEQKGIESPKVAAPADSAPRSDPMLDKAIEKQMH